MKTSESSPTSLWLSSTLKLEDKQRILEISDPGKRLEELLNMMTGEIEILEVEKKIRNRVKKQMEKSQKEYYLNEQMQAIQKELGDKDDYQAELAELEERAAKMNWSKGRRRKSEERNQEAQDDVSDECRGDSGSKLHRLDAGSALV